MSSMRNAVQRRNHKERAQPLERAKWGLLEKRKDYKLRAKDHNDKKRRLKALRQKATERNPDEFAFGMMSSTTKKGVKITERGNENGTSGTLDFDLAKLLKTQDAGYLQTVLQQTKKELARAREQLIILENGVVIDATQMDVGKKKTFDEDGNEIASLALLKDDLDFDSEDDEEEEAFDPATMDVEEYRARKRQRRHIEVTKNKVRILSNREKKLSQALDTLDAQRAKMHNTVGGVNKKGIKFRILERKR